MFIIFGMKRIRNKNIYKVGPSGERIATPSCYGYLILLMKNLISHVIFNKFTKLYYTTVNFLSLYSISVQTSITSVNGTLDNRHFMSKEAKNVLLTFTFLIFSTNEKKSFNTELE